MSAVRRAPGASALVDRRCPAQSVMVVVVVVEVVIVSITHGPILLGAGAPRTLRTIRIYFATEHWNGGHVACHSDPL